ncbi:MAG: DUF374 domain-containing protein [Desulfobacteraceae bacterium]|nr:MAG: DUF374 domain-containing protein [Desulfobacteraceae bacterium]
MSVSLSKEYRKYRNYGNYISVVVRLLKMTINLKVEYHTFESAQDNFIYVFWHQNIFTPTVSFPGNSKRFALVSPSKDGEIMAAICNNFGFDVVRGSSNQQNIKSLIKVIRKLKKGYSLGLAADGPQGPMYQVKPGIIYMAMKTGVSIVPIGGAFKRKYEFKKAWDKFQLPYPFNRGATVVGHPISVPPDADIDEYIETVNQGICKANTRACRLLSSHA